MFGVILGRVVIGDFAALITFEITVCVLAEPESGRFGHHHTSVNERNGSGHHKLIQEDC